MALKDWKRRRSKNPYIPYSYINTKRGLLLEIHYDVGFGKHRNVTVYNYRNQKLSGYEVITTMYCDDINEAKGKAKRYMEMN